MRLQVLCTWGRGTLLCDAPQWTAVQWCMLGVSTWSYGEVWVTINWPPWWRYLRPSTTAPWDSWVCGAPTAQMISSCQMAESFLQRTSTYLQKRGCITLACPVSKPYIFKLLSHVIMEVIGHSLIYWCAEMRLVFVKTWCWPKKVKIWSHLDRRSLLLTWKNHNWSCHGVLTCLTSPVGPEMQLLF